MTTDEAVRKFVQKGGVITLFDSHDADRPIRFSAKLNSVEWTGTTEHLGNVLLDVLEPRVDDPWDFSERPDY